MKTISLTSTTSDCRNRYWRENRLHWSTSIDNVDGEMIIGRVRTKDLFVFHQGLLAKGFCLFEENLEIHIKVKISAILLFSCPITPFNLPKYITD